MNLITGILISVAGIFILIVIFALVTSVFVSSINDTSYIGAEELMKGTDSKESFL